MKNIHYESQRQGEREREREREREIEIIFGREESGTEGERERFLGG